MARFALASVRLDRRDAVAAVVDDRVHPLEGPHDMLELLREWDRWFELLHRTRFSGGLPAQDVRFLAPIANPPNLYMAGANYLDHAREMSGDPLAPAKKHPKGPFMFLKPTTSITGHGHPIRLPAAAKKVDWEVELAAVIGRPARGVSTERAREHIAAYTILNDVSARDTWEREGAPPVFQWDWLLQKGWDTFCPMGPVLMPAAFLPDPAALGLRLRVNGSLEQDSNTSQMIFSTEEQVSYLSGIVPLVPGDVIGTGTCAGVGAGKGRFLQPGDMVEAEIEGIGTLQNPVVAAED